MGVGGQHHAPADYYQQKAPVPIVEEARWAPWSVWRKGNPLSLPGFEPPPFQPVEIRYTDYTILGPTFKYQQVIFQVTGTL